MGIGLNVPEGVQCTFNFDEFLHVNHVPAEEWPIGQQASDAAVLNLVVFRMAKLLHRYGNRLLTGDDLAFLALTKQRNFECRDYASRSSLISALKDAKQAWTKRNYVMVVKALGPYEQIISPSESAMLQYAKKMLAM